MRIFILDDEASIVEVLSEACKRDSHEVVTMTSSLEAIDYLSKEQVDLLVTDIAMPAPDGLQVIREARAANPNLVTLAMTGYLAKYALADVQTAGANDLIYKPLRIEEFRARVFFAEQRRRLVEKLNSRRRELQQMSADMIKGLQEELEDARKSARTARTTPRPN